MKRVSQDYRTVREVICAVCQRRIMQGMYVCDVELESGKKGVAHSLCEVKKLTEQ